MLDGLLVVPRTVEFEPGLNEETGAVADGKIIVVNTQSTNYVDRFLARRELCIALLAELIEGLLIEAPDRRGGDWFKPLGMRARWRRLRQLVSALARIPR
jgi:hypothetical protein